jgi:hypothetical protein
MKTISPAISHINFELKIKSSGSTLMMETEEIFETFFFISTLTRMIVRDDFNCLLNSDGPNT